MLLHGNDCLKSRHNDNNFENENTYHNISGQIEN